MAIDINIPIEDAVTDGSLNPVTSNAVFDALAALPSGTVTSVGLTMPSAFTVSNSPITSSGDIAVTGAGVASQYVRGDGSLANFPTSSGGGASVSYYLNGSVSQGTFGGVAMREINKVPIIGAGTDFTINANGYIQSFITDANDPNQLEIPSGNWNFETYFSSSSSGGNPSFYVELYKWDGTSLSLIASNSTNPEIITGGTAIDLYLTALAVPQTTLSLTDRLVVRIYVTPSGRTIKLHTEDNHLSQIITTFSTGLTSLNGITAQTQNLATGTSGTDFTINSSGSTHTFNLPTASAANRGALSTTDWTTFNNKQATLVSGTNIKTVNGNSLLGSGDITISGGGGITVGSTAVTSGTDTRVFFQQGGVVEQDANFTFNNTQKRLTLKAVGTALTDIPFRVRNSADTADLFVLNGSKAFNLGGGLIGDGFTTYLSSQTGVTQITASGNGLVMTSNFLTQINAVNQLTLQTNSVTRINLDNVGNVGIGSASPAARLDVRAQGALSTDIAFRVRNSADTANLFNVQGDGVANVLSRINVGFSGMTTTGGALYVYAGGSEDFVSRWYNTAGVNIMSIRTVGNGGKLTISSSSGVEGVTIDGQNSNALTFGAGRDIWFNTSTGTRIGAATNQKFAFWNATPIVQPTTAITAATFVTNTSGILNDTATFDGYTIGQVVKALRNIGILA